MTPPRPVSERDRDLTYRDKHLGMFSSHPQWLKRWSTLFSRLVVVVAVGLYLLVLFAWLRGSVMSGLVSAFFNWARFGVGLGIAGLAAFIIGVLTAASFQLRLAAYKSNRQEGRSRDNISWDPAMIVAWGAGGLVLPMLLTFLPGMPFEIRIFGALLATLPAITLAYLLPAVGRKQRFPYVWVFLLIPIASIGSFLTNAGAWLHSNSPAWLGEFFPLLQSADGWRNAAGAVGIVMAAMLLFRIAGWWRTRALPGEDGLLEKMFRRVRLFFTKKRAVQSLELDEEQDDGAGYEERLSVEWLQEWVHSQQYVVDPIKSIAPGLEEATDWSQDAQFDLFFAGQRPTIDQWKVVQAFLWLQQNQLNQGKHKTVACGFELLLEGPSGAGKSATLDALSVLSLVAGGMRSAYLVADEGRIAFARDRIDAAIQHMGLGSFLRVGTVDDIDISAPDDQVPDILITTPALWEERLYGHVARSGSPEVENARNIMLRFGAVFLDDWMEHPVEVRAHLPFLLDKHRLLLESEGIPRACVVAFPSLTAAGRKMAIDRIIGHDGVIDEKRQWHTLRYRPLSPIDVLDLHVDGIDETLELLFQELAKAQMDVILMRKGIDHQEAAAQTEQIRLQHHNSNVTVCYCEDHLAACEGPASAILMKAISGSDTALAIRSRRPSDELVVLRLSGLRELATPDKLTPLFLERSGRGFAESHLHNVLRFIRPRVPVPQRIWGQLGLEAPKAESSVRIKNAKGSLRIDLPPSDQANAHYLKELGGYVALDEPFRGLEVCDLYWIPEPSTQPVLIAGESTDADLLVLAERTDQPQAEQPVVVWLGNEGTELGKSQLHHQQELVLRRRRVFAPNSITRDSSGSFIFNATSFEGNGTDLIHQKFNLSWSFPPVEPESDASVETGFGGPDHRYLWLSKPGTQQVTVACNWFERTDNLDRPNLVGPYDFSYQAKVSTLLLAPRHRIFKKPHEFKQALSSVFDSDIIWNTEHHEDFLPGLTYALTRAVEAVLPSAGFFGKFLVFRLQGDAAEYASALVCIVEPYGVGGTLRNAIEGLLKEPGFLTDLATQLDVILRQGWEKSPAEAVASFWLPHRCQRPISLFERRLVAAMAEPLSEPPPTSEELHQDWHFTCQECGEVVDIKARWGAGIFAFDHCGAPGAMLVSKSEKEMIEPCNMVHPWWPDDLNRPSGSDETLTRAVWEAVAERLDYISDHRQIEKAADCWLRPAEAWQRGIGDCEDHAVLVASMLLHLRIEAWVVWGTAGSYHAWVEATIGERHVLIEATLKTLPETIPIVEEASKHYRETYIPETRYPGRCNDSEYGIYDGSQWKVVQLAKALPGKSI